jgi:hypothetical protein
MSDDIVECVTEVMMIEDSALLLYSIENVIAQMADAPHALGMYTMRFYSDGIRPSRERTDAIDTFLYFPSGGTVRDKDMNILFYEPKLDAYNPGSRIPKP